MTWRDQLQPGSFRGVPFDFLDAGGSVGRRVAVHEYPLRDKPWAEDLGRKVREFTIDAFVLGDDYMDGRDALIGALEAEGPGTLVHPRLGSLTVSVTNCRLRESVREGGMARFSITFIESGEKIFPSNAPDTAERVRTQAATTRASLQSQFPTQVKVSGFPGFVTDAAVDQTAELVRDLRDAITFGPTVPSQVTHYLAQLNNVEQDLATIVQTPSIWAGRVSALFPALSNSFEDTTTASSAARSLSTFGATRSAVPTTTTTRQRQAANQVAIDQFVRRQALIEGVTLSADTEFPSFNDATAERDRLARALDDEMLGATDDDFVALSDLRVAMIRDITARGADLASIVQFTPVNTVPSLVLSYRLYGTINGEDDIVARNRIRHPGFIVGDRSLEVLTDVA